MKSNWKPLSQNCSELYQKNKKQRSPKRTRKDFRIQGRRKSFQEEGARRTKAELKKQQEHETHTEGFAGVCDRETF